MTLEYQEEWSPKQLTETAVPLSVAKDTEANIALPRSSLQSSPIDCQPGALKKGGLQSSLQRAKTLNNGLIHVALFVLQPSL